MKTGYITKHKSKESISVAVFIALIILLQFVIMGSAIIMFNIMLIIAFLVWLKGEEYKNSSPAKIIKIYLIGIGVQCFHFGEEYLTGFQTSLPELFGYTWTDKQFLVFNLIWLCIFILAAWGALKKLRISYFIIWFYAIAGGIGNGVFHPLLSITQGKYFSGLFTSFVSLIIGVILIKELIKVRKELSLL